MFLMSYKKYRLGTVFVEFCSKSVVIVIRTGKCTEYYL